MDDQERLVEKVNDRNALMQQRLQEVTEELEARKRELTEVYQRLGQAEERITLLGRPQEVLEMAAAAPPPTTAASSTQTEGPPALDAQRPAAPPSAVPPPPTIEVEGPTPHNSQEGEKATGLLVVPPAPALSTATQAVPWRQSRSRSRSPVANPADLRRSPRLATPTPSAVAEPSPPPVAETTPGEPTVPRRSPRLATPDPSPGSLKRSSTPADKEPPAKKRRV